MKHRAWLVVVVWLAGCAPQNTAAVVANAAGTSAGPRPPIQHPAGEIAYGSAPASMPAGVQMAVLEGDPKAEGMFTLRLKAPPGFALPPHTHPTDERVTVLEGTISVGFGTSVDRSVAKSFGAGSFYVNPPGVAHFVYSDEGATVQITGQGPWRVDAVRGP